MIDFPPGHRDRDAHGPYEVLAVDGDYRLVRYDDGREARRLVGLLRIAAANRRFYTGPPAPVSRSSRIAPPRDSRESRNPSRRVAKPGQPTEPDTPTFSLAETSPLVADLIRRLAGDPPQFVSHDQLATALLADPAGERLIKAAREVQGDDRAPAAIAANMVAWFSQQITTGASPYSRDFLRRKSRGRWAYRPRVIAPSARATGDKS